MSVRALLLTGTLGVGKTSVAAAVGDQLRERQVANAVVDLDDLRRTTSRSATSRHTVSGTGTASACCRRSSAVSRTPASTRVVKPDST